MKLVASATLRSVEDSAYQARITLEDAAEVMHRRAASRDGAGESGTDRGEELLSGSALIKQDMWKAVVNATLDAVNRRFIIAQER